MTPDDDPNLYPLNELTADQREINALKHEIAWLREAHRDVLKQLADSYARVPPAPYTLHEPNMVSPLPSPFGTRAVSAISLERLNQLLAVERTAKDICSATKRDAFRPEAGSVQVPLILMTELIRALNQLPQLPQLPQDPT